MTIMIKQIKGK